MYNFINIIFEPHVKHTVCLIEYNALNLTHIQHAAVDEVIGAAGGRDDDVGPAGQVFLVQAPVGATLKLEYFQIEVIVPARIGQKLCVFVGLSYKFSCRVDNDNFWVC